MVNYNEGKIYKLISEQTDKIYIGSTAKKLLNQRLESHREKFLEWIKNNTSYTTSFEILQYNDYKIILIENYPCNSKDELRQREQYWIDKNKDICVNMRNSYISKEERKEQKNKYHKIWYSINNKRIKNKSKEWYKNNKERVKKLHSENKLCIYCDRNMIKSNYLRHCKGTKHKQNMEYFNSILNS